MPTNLLKKYPELLELSHLNEYKRTQSLIGIFRRDIENNHTLNFRTKIIRPIKGEEPEVSILFKHLTSKEITIENYSKRIFEMDRSQRLHWIKFHLDEKKKQNIEVFSVEERNKKKRKNIIRTYIYDTEQKYVIILDPQRSQKDYYLITAYYLNEKYGEKNIQNKMKRKLYEVI